MVKKSENKEIAQQALTLNRWPWQLEWRILEAEAQGRGKVYFSTMWLRLEDAKEVLAHMDKIIKGGSNAS